MEQRDAATSKSVTARSVGFRCGLILGIVIVAHFLILTLAGIDATQGFWLWSKYVFIIGLIYLAHRYFKLRNGGMMEYGQGVAVASWAGVVFGLIDGGFRYVYMQFIDPGFLQKINDSQIAEMKRSGMSEAEIKHAASITSLFMNAELISFIVFLSAVLGAVVIGLLLSIFTRNVFTRKP